VRAGALLPMWPVQQYVGEHPHAPVTLHVYPGAAVSHLYEDAGDGPAQGTVDFRHTQFTTRWDGSELRLERQFEGTFNPGYPGFEIAFHALGNEPPAILADGVLLTARREPEQGPVVWVVQAGEFDVIVARRRE
jgi:alpha-glucosidase